MRPYLIEIPYDKVHSIVKDELKEAIRLLLDSPWCLYHNYGKAKQLVDCILEVLKYYSCPDEFKEYKKSIKKEYKELKELVKTEKRNNR